MVCDVISQLFFAQNCVFMSSLYGLAVFNRNTMQVAYVILNFLVVTWKVKQVRLIIYFNNPVYLKHYHFNKWQSKKLSERALSCFSHRVFKAWCAVQSQHTTSQPGGCPGHKAPSDHQHSAAHESNRPQPGFSTACKPKMDSTYWNI